MAARFVCMLTLLLSALNCGCESAWHNLQPHRLWRLNQTPSRQQSSYYSVSDDVLSRRPRHAQPEDQSGSAEAPEQTPPQTSKSATDPDAPARFP